MKKILIIDDQKDNLISIGALLKNYIPDCEILTALSSQKGIDIAVNEQPDTILLDIIMPEMDGYETCRKLKNDVSTKHIPVIMLTAIKTDPESRVKGLNFGADAFLSKPVDSAELSAQVNVMLRIKEAEDKLRAEKDILDEKVKERTEELKKSTINILKSEKKYKSLFDNINVAVALHEIVTDENDNPIDLIWLDVNPTYEKLTGYNRADIIGKRLLDVVPDFNKNKMEVYFKVVQTGKSITLIDYAEELDKYWDVKAYSPKKNQFAIAFTDITDRMKVEKALLNSEKRFRDISSSMADWIWEIDVEGKYTYCSGKVEEILGYTPEEILGKTPFDFIVPEDTARFTKLVNNIFAKKEQIKNIENWNINKNGQHVCTLTNGVPMLDEKGGLIGYRGVDIDITERKNAEDKLEKRLSELQIFYDSTVDREIKMLELKKEINDMLVKEGNRAKYEIPV